MLNHSVRSNIKNHGKSVLHYSQSLAFYSKRIIITQFSTMVCSRQIYNFCYYFTMNFSEDILLDISFSLTHKKLIFQIKCLIYICFKFTFSFASSTRLNGKCYIMTSHATIFIIKAIVKVFCHCCLVLPY